MDKTTLESENALLDRLPVALVWLAPDGRIHRANQAAADLLGAPATTLAGTAVNALPAWARHLVDAEGTQPHDSGGRRALRRAESRGDDGSRLVALIDISEEQRLAEENARLSEEVADLRLTDDLTGLPNRRAIGQALELHISRSRRYQNPLSVVVVRVDTRGVESAQPLSPDPVTLAVSRFLRDRLRWVDQIARWADDAFLLVLPETGESDARGLLDKISGEQDSLALPEGYGDLRPELAFGLACWSKGDDMRTLLRRALEQVPGAGGD